MKINMESTHLHTVQAMRLCVSVALCVVHSCSVVMKVLGLEDRA